MFHKKSKLKKIANCKMLQYLFPCCAKDYTCFRSPASIGLASDFPDVNNGSGMCKPPDSLAFNTAETLILVQISSTAICLPNTGLKIFCVWEKQYWLKLSKEALTKQSPTFWSLLHASGFVFQPRWKSFISFYCLIMS